MQWRILYVCNTWASAVLCGDKFSPYCIVGNPNLVRLINLHFSGVGGELLENYHLGNIGNSEQLTVH